MKRRGFLFGLGAALTAPAIVRAESLMRIAVLRETVTRRVVRTGLPSTQWTKLYSGVPYPYQQAIIEILSAPNPLLDILPYEPFDETDES
jgi:hypothetical protein